MTYLVTSERHSAPGYVLLSLSRYFWYALLTEVLSPIRYGVQTTCRRTPLYDIEKPLLTKRYLPLATHTCGMHMHLDAYFRTSLAT